MEPADLILQLKDVFASPLAADVFKTIYLDPLLFQAFDEPDAIEKCKNKCGTEPENWTVINIALALVDLPITRELLNSEPLETLPAELRQKVSTYYQKVLQNPTYVNTLEEAVMLSIALRERRRLTGSWAGLCKEISHNFSRSQFNQEDWISAASMVYAMDLDANGFLEEISLFSTLLTDIEYFVLLARILLSRYENTRGNPSPYFLESVRILDEVNRIKALEWLHGYGYDELAHELSAILFSEIEQNGEKTKGLLSKREQDPLELDNQLDLINKLTLEQKRISFSPENDTQSTYLLQQEELIQQAQARLEAQKARLLTGEAKIRAWTKVLELVPHSDLAKAELVTAFLQNNDLNAAQSIVFGDSANPFVLASRALLAYRQGNLMETDLFLDRIITVLKTDSFPETESLKRIMDICAQIKLLDKVDQLLAMMPAGLPVQQEAIKIRAKIAFEKKNHIKARQLAAASLLLDEGNPDSLRILANSHEEEADYDNALGYWEKLLDNPKGKNPKDDLSYAACAIHSGKAEKALAICKDYIEQFPTSGEGFLIFGDAYQQLGDYQKAGENYEKAITLSPELEDPWIKLVNFHTANENLDKAFSILQTAVKAVPNSAKLNFSLGTQLFKNGSASEAIPLFQKAAAIDPTNLEFVRTLAESYQKTGQWQEAEDIYADLAKKFPSDQTILLDYAKTLIKINRKSDALLPLQQLVDLNPVGTEAYMLLGQLVVDDLTPDADQINPNDAETIALLDYSRDVIQNASVREPSETRFILLLAEILTKMGEKEAAQKLFASLTEQINSLPENLRWRVSYGLGITSGQMGEFEVALAALQEAAQQNPQNMQIHQQLAEAFIKANLSQSALQAAQQALAIDPRDPDNLIWYANFCIRSHDLPEALSTMDAIIKIQPENSNLRIQLGAMHLQAGDLKNARHTFDRLIAENKLSPGQFQQMAQLLADNKEYVDAASILKQGIQQDPQSSLPLLMDLVQYEQKAGDISSALNTLETAIAMDPGNVYLQVIKADMFAFEGIYGDAILTLEGILNTISPDGSTNHPFEFRSSVLLRLAFLYRKAGEFEKAATAARSILEFEPDSAEANYILADLASQALDFTNLQTQLSSSQSSMENGSQASDMLVLLNIYMSQLAGTNLYQNDTLALNNRWYLWNTALENISQPADRRDEQSLQSLTTELENINLDEIDLLLPTRGNQDALLPDVPAYDILMSSPIPYLVLAEAATITGLYDTAYELLNQTRDRFPLDTLPVYCLARLYVIQAEDFRLYESVKIKKHLPPSDSLSLGSYETFEELILAVERVSESPIIKAWHTRGIAAFHPTLDNIAAVDDTGVFVKEPRFKIAKLAKENNVAGLIQAIQKDPENSLRRIEGAVLSMDKAPQEALQMLDEFETRLSSHPIVLAGYALTAGEAGESEEALAAIEKALSIWNDEPLWHVFASKWSRDLKFYEGAVAHLKAAADLEPENFEYALEIGKSALEMSDPQMAIQYLRKAAHLDPIKYQPWLYMAKTYQLIGDLPQAIASIERAVTLAPNEAEPQVFSAGLSLDAGHIEDALKKIDNAIRLDPRNVEGIIVKTKALKFAGHADEALELIERSLGKVANTLPLLIAKAEVIRDKEGQKAYLKSLQEIAQDYPRDAQILQMYAQALAENGSPADALQITQHAIKADPDNLPMHLLAGRLLRSTGQLDQAIDHFSACINIDPELIEAYLEMARTYQERRDFTKAISLFEQVIDIAPNDFRGYYQLGLLLRDAKDYRGAETMLRRASELNKDDVNILRQLGAIIALNLVHHPQEASVHS